MAYARGVIFQLWVVDFWSSNAPLHQHLQAPPTLIRATLLTRYSAFF